MIDTWKSNRPTDKVSYTFMRGTMSGVGSGVTFEKFERVGFPGLNSGVHAGISPDTTDNAVEHVHPADGPPV